MVFALGPGLLAFLVTTLLSFIAVSFLTLGPLGSQWALSKDNIGTISVRFNKPIDGYKVGDVVSIAISPETNCFLRVFYTEKDQALILFPPPGTGLLPEVKASHHTIIDGYGNYKLKSDARAGGNIHLFLLKKDEPLVTKEEYEKIDPDNCLLPISAIELKKRMSQIQKEQIDCIHEVFDAPQAVDRGASEDAEKPSKEETKKAVEKTSKIESEESEESDATSNESVKEDTLNDISGRHGEVVDEITDSKMEKEAEAILRANQSKEGNVSSETEEQKENLETGNESN